MARRKSSITPQFEFDPRLGSVGRYTDKATGRVVSKATVDSALESQINDARLRGNKIATRLANGKISLSEYQTSMMHQMKLINTQSAALAKGGWAQMTQGDWGAVGNLSREQYDGLNRYAEGIASGKVKLRRLDGEINGQFLRTSDQFTQGGAQMFNEMKRREAGINGFTHEMRVLDSAAQHCDCCIGEAGHWEPLGTLTKIGNCTCSKNCRCHFEFGTIQADGSIVTVREDGTQETITAKQVQEPPKVKTQAQIEQRKKDVDPLSLGQVRRDDFTPEYYKAIDNVKFIQKNGEFEPNELNNARLARKAEERLSQIAKGRGFVPGKMGAIEWEDLADQLKQSAGEKLKFSTKALREAAANRAAGRKFISNPAERRIIQIGGKDVDQKWVGGSRKEAAQKVKGINARTKEDATDFMQGQLRNFGYTSQEVNKMGYTQSRKLLSEIGNDVLLSDSKIAGIDFNRRIEVAGQLTDTQKLSSRSIAMNPRAGEGLGEWSDYQNAMVKAGKTQEIQYAPELLEEVLPDFLKKADFDF